MDKKSFSYLTAVETFLLSPDGKQVLLIKRAENKEVLPGYFGGVGGKMDSAFVESPLEAAYRELLEETDFKRTDIDGLQLKAVFTVHDRFGKWNVYEFVGQAKKKSFEKTKPIDEGILEWIDIDSLPDINLIQDLRAGNLERIILSEKILWFKVEYGDEDRMISIEDRED